MQIQATPGILDLQHSLGFKFLTSFLRAKRLDTRQTPFPELTQRMKCLAKELSITNLSEESVYSSEIAAAEILKLFCEFGPRLWPDVGSNRRWLFTAEEHQLYSKDLYYSVPDDFESLKRKFSLLLRKQISKLVGKFWYYSDAPEPGSMGRSRYELDEAENGNRPSKARRNSISTVSTRSSRNILQATGLNTLHPNEVGGSVNIEKEVVSDEIAVSRPSFEPQLGEDTPVIRPSLVVPLKSPMLKASASRGRHVPRPFLHIYFGDNQMSESSRISLKHCDSVAELFRRIDAQIPDSLGGKFTKKIKVEMGQPAKTFRIRKEGELEFEAWMDLLDEGGGDGTSKPAGYAEFI